MSDLPLTYESSQEGTNIYKMITFFQLPNTEYRQVMLQEYKVNRLTNREDCQRGLMEESGFKLVLDNRA